MKNLDKLLSVAKSLRFPGHFFGGTVQTSIDTGTPLRRYFKLQVVYIRFQVPFMSGTGASFTEPSRPKGNTVEPKGPTLTYYLSTDWFQNDT